MGNFFIAARRLTKNLLPDGSRFHTHVERCCWSSLSEPRAYSPVHFHPQGLEGAPFTISAAYLLARQQTRARKAAADSSA